MRATFRGLGLRIAFRAFMLKMEVRFVKFEKSGFHGEYIWVIHGASYS